MNKIEKKLNKMYNNRVKIQIKEIFDVFRIIFCYNNNRWKFLY